MDEQRKRDHDWLAEQFETSRARLRAVAYRMLGSLSEADDAVQESWLRLSRSDTSAVDNLGGWLTRVVARVCLDMLRVRAARREETLEAAVIEPPVSHDDRGNPEDQALLADSLGLALLVVLDSLSPAERLAFVLHDLFDVPFDEIAPIVGRTPIAARQLASRARRRVRGQRQEYDEDSAMDATTDSSLTRQREIVAAFLAAARGGDFDALLALLDPEVIYRADGAAVAVGSTAEIRGAAAVARQFAGRAQFAQAALVDGAAGAVWAPSGQPRVIFAFIIGDDGRIAAIELIADPARIQQIELTIPDR